MVRYSLSAFLAMRQPFKIYPQDEHRCLDENMTLFSTVNLEKTDHGELSVILQVQRCTQHGKKVVG
jgi:hypothetical protein